MASCAVCLQPILRGQRFVLDGTEVFHPSCVQQAYRSRLRIAEAKVRELESYLADTRRAASRVESETHQLRNDSTMRRAEVAVLEGRLAGMRAELDLGAERLEARQNELVAARRENAALRAELAALKPVDEQAEEEGDATVKRFKLLELD